MPDWADPIGVIVEEGIKIVTGDEDAAGKHTLPPAQPGGNFQRSIQAQADDPNANHTLGKRKLDPNADHTLGKRKKPLGMDAIAGKFDPNASTSVQLPNLPNGGGNGGGGAPPSPTPPTIPAPVPAPQGQPGGGFPWQDLVVGTAQGLANRPVAYDVPVYVPVAQPAVQQVVVNEATAAEPVIVEATPGSVDLVLDDLTLDSPATLIAGPAYRLKFRNQGTQAAGKFQVAILVGLQDGLAEDAPRAIVEVPSLVAGQVAELTLRLPLQSMKLVVADSQTVFTHLYVAVDFRNTVAELDETNNLAIVERSALDAAAE